MKRLLLLSFLLVLLNTFNTNAQVTLTTAQKNYLSVYLSAGSSGYIFSLGNVCPQDLTTEDLDWMHWATYNIDMPVIIMQPNKGLVFIHDNGTGPWYKFSVRNFNVPMVFEYTGTTAQTAASLNSVFSSAQPGDLVNAKNVGTGMVYTKLSTGQWMAQAASVLNP